jgi:hypothetical protein
VTSRGTEEFWRLYHGLPLEVRDSARKAFHKFSENPAHPGLQLERLKFDPRAWSVRVTRNYRAMARRYQDDWFWSVRTKNSIGAFQSEIVARIGPA